MDTHYDSSAQRTVVTEPADPLMAVAVVGLAVLCIVVWTVVWIIAPIRDTWAVVTGWVVLIVYAVFLWCVAMRDLTKVVATFDGKARTLTVTRTGPWRRTEQSFPYKDVVGVATRVKAGHGMINDGFELVIALLVITFRKYHRFDITLTGSRALHLRANSAAESDEAVKQVHLAMSGASGA
jgi:hypothetical protein